MLCLSSNRTFKLVLIYELEPSEDQTLLAAAPQLNVFTPIETVPIEDACILCLDPAYDKLKIVDDAILRSSPNNQNYLEMGNC